MKVLVIGGGIIGSSVAWQLARAGAQVQILERARAGQEASWAAAGLLAPQAEAEGPGPLLRLCVEGKAAFEETFERLLAESGVDPEYEFGKGVLYVALNEEERAELARRAAWQRAAGLTVEELSGDQARAMVAQVSPEVCHALYFRNDFRAENRKLTQAYLSAALRAGARLREETRVDAIELAGGKVAGLRLGDGSTIEADAVVNAAGSWASQIRGTESDKLSVFPVRGQIVCFEVLPGTLELGIFSLRGYVVPRRDGRLLAGSTRERAGFSKSVTLEGVERIARGAKDMLPMLAGARFREAWAGLRPATPDSLPVLGPSPTVDGLFYACGHFRSGILLSAITGRVITSLVMGRKPEFDIGAFSPARFTANNGAAQD